MKEYFARICYNTLDWKRPSGFEGKGVSKNIYERENGFGHEEWLFDESKIIDGYHYAFLQPMGCFTYAGEIVDVHLYCRSLMSGKLYLGILHNVECITSKQYKDAYKIYVKNGWLKEMKSDITAIGGNTGALDNNNYPLFNIRFKLKDMDINLSNPRIISEDDPNTRSSRYRRYSKKGDIKFSNIPDKEKKQHKAVELKSEQKVQFNTDVRQVSYDPLHNKMQNAIKKILERTGKYKTVLIEKNSVDIIAVSLNGKKDYYELKTYAAKASIRAALGQILEYVHYPAEKNADRMIIVGPNKPDKYDVLYLQYLRDTYKLPVWYQRYSFENNSLSEMT